ncbi:unnamed protein product [Cylicocyclus nassatus]|uniref:Peptidase A1 domain-containing protein n=1 Tax=Cylicocyclus nassatus TaxID=53992 RepID=A0AA36M8W9_CYLNA|nr:unnamed protein product [Cylicocyclus nassatus]
MNNAMPELISSITGPQAGIDGLAKAAGAMPKLGSYEIQCNAAVPKLEIKAERFTYTIQSNKLIVKIGNRCILALVAQTSAGIGPQWHFGAPLLQEYCITFNLDTNNLEFFGVKSVPTTTSSTLRTASTRKQNTTSTSKTTRKIPTTTPKNATSSSTKTTRRVLSTTPKLNITTSSTRTTRKIPTTTPKRNITTSSTRTTRRLPTTTPRRISTSSRKTTRRYLAPR